MSSVIVVTGSRSLCEIPGARERCMAVLRPLIAKASLVIAGDAPGPDEWALSLATGTEWERWEWRVPRVVTNDPSRDWRWSERASAKPLERNAAMVNFCANRFTSPLSRGLYDVLVLGFIDPASRTNGTKHTLDNAAKCGLKTKRYAFDKAKAVT